MNSVFEKLGLLIRRSRSRRRDDSAPISLPLALEVFLRTWDLGFISFGGPPVHFQIFHQRFVQKYKWIDEQTYQEMFALCQTLPGPASTKLGFCITMQYAGFPYAVMSFLLWCAPGVAGMFALAIGVSHINDTLPPVVYALLSGLNAAVVGIIALAAVQLSQRAITDQMSRAIVIGSACAGMCYTALWYYPVLMVIGACLTVLWDVLGLRKFVSFVRRSLSKNPERRRDVAPSEEGVVEVEMQTMDKSPSPVATLPAEPEASQTRQQPTPPRALQTRISLRWGLLIAALFFAAFITIMVLRSTLINAPIVFRLFSNLFLAGTIIFGGGPVVIPLLKEYVVTEGWVSSRDFLIGLALIQAFPGPNFNFAVYLAALASYTMSASPAETAVLGFIGIFFPGLILATSASSIWAYLRRYQTATSALRGINAAAVGLVWTAVYRLWEIGYLTETSTSGTSLSREPWWVVVAATAFCGNRWFSVPAPVSILSGGVLGIAWWGAVGKNLVQ